MLDKKEWKTNFIILIVHCVFYRAGEVIEVGEGITSVKVGDRAVGLGGGSHAEYFLVTDANIKAAKIPDNVSYETAAALGIQGLTAVTLIEKGYIVQKGDVVLVHAAAGGVGSLLVQLIHQKGATVIGSVSSDEKAEFIKKLGADYAINYKKENIVDRVLEITDGEGVHASLDSVGGADFEKSLKAIRSNGVVISFGTAAGPPPPVSSRIVIIDKEGEQLLTFLSSNTG
jgi:NADPH2:quinone reductase